jgi:NAD(P)-dependent dehydrogenase (short-subunit alcohol dehydrogenase family)
MRADNANAAAEIFKDAGFDVSTAIVDVSSREAVESLAANAAKLGWVTGLVHAAGVSPSQASIETILKVDLYGTALVLKNSARLSSKGAQALLSPRSPAIASRR